jgi:hypothetical protein
VLLRVCTAAVQTIGDAVTRASILTSARVLGLRGGSFDVSNRASEQKLALHNFRFVNDLRLDGTATNDAATSSVAATVTVHGAANGILTIHWDAKDPRDIAAIDGVLNGVAMHATAPSP